jgi:hypothetical protein
VVHKCTKVSYKQRIPTTCFGHSFGLLQGDASQRIYNKNNWYSALGPVWEGTRAQSGNRYGSGTLHPGQVLRGSLPLLSPKKDVYIDILQKFVNQHTDVEYLIFYNTWFKIHNEIQMPGGCIDYPPYLAPRLKKWRAVECVWNLMAHAQKPDFVFRRNWRVHLNWRGRQFSRLQAAEVCASAVVMLDTPRSEVVWRVLATHSIRQFPLHFPFRASPCAIRFQTHSTSTAPLGLRGLL